MCILMIELIWVAIWKKGRKTHILGKIRGPVPVQVRAVPVQVVLCFFYFDQRLYFGHNLLISYPF